LGTRSRLRSASRRSPFTLDGATRVRFTPDDDGCIAAEVITVGNLGLARLSAEIHTATHLNSAGQMGRQICAVGRSGQGSETSSSAEESEYGTGAGMLDPRIYR
jgi:hypothetical protein